MAPTAVAVLGARYVRQRSAFRALEHKVAPTVGVSSGHWQHWEQGACDRGQQHAACPHNSPVDMHHAPFRTPQARGRRLPLNPRFAVPTHMHARPLIFPFVYFHSSLSPFLCDIFPSISPVKTHTFFFLKYLCHERCF